MAKAAKVLSIPSSALVVLVGVAGSGKSTFAYEHFRATEVLSSDFFRGMVSDDESDQSASADAFALLHLALEKRLSRGKLCVVDATNIRPDHRVRLLHTARSFGRPSVAIVFDTPLSLCVERAASRVGRKVNAAVVQDQSRELMPQSDKDLLEEGFAHVFRILPSERIEIRRSRAATAQR